MSSVRRCPALFTYQTEQRRMPRRARLKIAGYPLHLVQRGNDGMACFRAECDYVLYLGLLNELAPLFECDVHAYVLMTNHVHLLLTAENVEGPSSLMKHLGQRYVQTFNGRYKRKGTLWSGRFHSSLIDSQDYLFVCQRYIELNPVRAGMVEHPWEYRWSSYGVNSGREFSTFLSPHPLYMALAETSSERVKTYQRLFQDPLSDDQLSQIRSALKGGLPLGNPEFISTVEGRLKRCARRGLVGRPKKGTVPPDGKIGSVPGFSGQAGGVR